MYADKITPSMAAAIDETNRRRDKQVAYNTARGLDPQPLRKKIADITDMLAREDADTEDLVARAGGGRTVSAGADSGRRPTETWRAPTSAIWPAWSANSPPRCTPRPRSCSSSWRPGCATRSPT